MRRLVLFPMLALLAACGSSAGAPGARAVSALRFDVTADPATLDRLEDKRLLSSRLSDPTPERGGRAKRCYRLEAAGERALRDAALANQRMSAALTDVWGAKWERRWQKV